MRIAIVTFSEKTDSGIVQIAKELARGFQNAFHAVEIINGTLDGGKKLGSYDYICVGSEFRGFFPQSPPPSFRAFFQDAGSVRGKRTLAFVESRFCGGEKALAILMRALEAEGLFLHNQKIFKDGTRSRRFAQHYLV